MLISELIDELNYFYSTQGDVQVVVRQDNGEDKFISEAEVDVIEKDYEDDETLVLRLV